MARSRNPKSKPPQFVALYDWEMQCPAYRCLSVYGRSLLIEFRAHFNGHNNGEIVMSVRQAAKLLNCSKDTAMKAIHELESKGWIVEKAKGSFNQKTNKTASTWRITNQPLGLGVDVPATKEYMSWQPDKKQNTVPNNRTVCPTSSYRDDKTGPTRTDHTPPTCPASSYRKA
jgi:DNA-binding transcriptional MocR family regulator